MAYSLSRRLYRSILSNPRTPYNNLSSIPFSKKFSSSHSDDTEPEPEPESHSLPSSQSTQQRPFTDRPLENGLDVGIYKVYSHIILFLLR